MFSFPPKKERKYFSILSYEAREKDICTFIGIDLCIKHPLTYFNHFFFNQRYAYLKTEYPQLQSNDVVFSIKSFFISAGTDCMILHRQYSQRPLKFRPGRTILKLVGTSNSKAINVKKRGKTIITLHTFRGATENLSQARPPDHR